MERKNGDSEGTTGFSADLAGMQEFLQAASMKRKRDGESRKDENPVILFFNILNFTYYNYSRGLSEGDLLLKKIGDILREVFPDDLIGHFDADHFAVLSADNTDAKVRAAYSRIAEELLPNIMDCRIGACEWSGDRVTASEACSRAKLACDSIHDAKDRYFTYYSDEMRRHEEIRAYLLSHIDEAIENGWIEVYYQPLVRTDTGEVCGMEALSRWNDPKYGFLAPVQFIDALEENELIYKLDTCVISMICEQLAKCREEGIPAVPVSFNLSRMDFLRADIFRAVDDAVISHNLPRNMLNIEVVERVFRDRDDVITVCLKRFSRAGYKIWMDDFGSGYSTLNLLKDFRFDVVKLDMAFLRSGTSRARSIIRSVVEMNRRLGAMSLAEGVEEEEQYRFLKEIGCHMAQGYFFGKPLPFDECMKYLRERKFQFEPALFRKPRKEASDKGKARTCRKEETELSARVSAAGDEKRLPNLAAVFDALQELEPGRMSHGKTAAILCRVHHTRQAEDRITKNEAELAADKIRDILGKDGVFGYFPGIFLAVCPYDDRAEISRICERMRVKIGEPDLPDAEKGALDVQIRTYFPDEGGRLSDRIFDSLSGEREDPNRYFKEAEARFRRILDPLPLGAYIVTPDRTILTWNRAAEEITGFSADWMIGRRCVNSGLRHIDDEGRHLCSDLCPFFAVLMDGKPRDKVVWGHTRGGELIRLHAYFAPICEDSGNIAEIVELFYRVDTPQEKISLRKSP